MKECIAVNSSGGGKGSLHQDPHALRPLSNLRDMILIYNLNVRLPRLKRHYLIPSKQRRERDIELRIRQIHPHTGPRAPTKRHELSRHRLEFIRRSQPAVRVERISGTEGRVLGIQHTSRKSINGSKNRFCSCWEISAF